MALKDEWKETGKGLGHAFGQLGKNIGRSAKTGIDAIDPDKEDIPGEPENTVFNDGSWRETGKDLGKAFLGVGKSILHSAKEGLEKIDPPSEEAKEETDGQ